MKRRPELQATFIYLAIGTLWIVFSDSLVLRIASSSSSLASEELQLAKGLLYVALTGVLVYLLVRSSTRATRRHNAELEQRIAERTAELSDLNRELQTRNADLAAFSYSISHDLRAPVRAVVGFAEIISSRHGASLSPEAQHYLENITDAGKRMNRLINDLLRYAHLGTATLAIEHLELESVIEAISDEFEPTLTELSGSLNRDAGGISVMVERSLLEQILSNLVQNAVQYRHPDRAPEISIRASRTKGFVELAVADNGIGVPPEHHERIFSLFQRLQDDHHDGTGIGLALARRAAELLGGSLSVQSTPGEGSTFVLSLPEAPR